MGERDGGALDIDLLVERFHMCLLRFEGGSRLIQRLLRFDLLVEEALGALITHAVKFQVGFGFDFLRLCRCQ
jgi:hypothetical protein